MSNLGFALTRFLAVGFALVLLGGCGSGGGSGSGAPTYAGDASRLLAGVDLDMTGFAFWENEYGAANTLQMTYSVSKSAADEFVASMQSDRFWVADPSDNKVRYKPSEGLDVAALGDGYSDFMPVVTFGDNDESPSSVDVVAAAGNRAIKPSEFDRLLPVPKGNLTGFLVAMYFDPKSDMAERFGKLSGDLEGVFDNGKCDTDGLTEWSCEGYSINGDGYFTRYSYAAYIDEEYNAFMLQITRAPIE